jgi:hypothetical protein
MVSLTSLGRVLTFLIGSIYLLSFQVPSAILLIIGVITKICSCRRLEGDVITEWVEAEVKAVTEQAERVNTVYFEKTTNYRRKRTFVRAGTSR